MEIDLFNKNNYPKIGTPMRVGFRSSNFHLLIVLGQCDPAMLVHKKSGRQVA